jgi:hypothetical protein
VPSAAKAAPALSTNAATAHSPARKHVRAGMGRTLGRVMD